MPHVKSGRPTPDEYDPYYNKYLDFVPEDDILPVLEDQELELGALDHFPNSLALHRYAPDKWTVKEVLGHLVDSERVIGMKMLFALRHDPAKIEWHDQVLWAQFNDANSRSIDDLLSEFRVLREANLLLLRRLTPEQWNSPRLEGTDLSARTLAYLLAGHIRYHFNILEERYIPSLP